MGRNFFLEVLYGKFRVPNSASRHYGRIALFGMGGIGKTQTALEFAYRSQASYSRIYWISGATQESMLDGYKMIANRAKVPLAPDSKPIAVAEQILLWLKKTPNWLLIIDNLDEIDVLSTRNLGEPNIVNLLLLESGTGQHTLITTRNPNADHIPAQALEVPLFQESDSVALLSSLSDIQVFPKSEYDLKSLSGPSAIRLYVVTTKTGQLGSLSSARGVFSDFVTSTMIFFNASSRGFSLK